ncbi:MAG: LptF/LptG family permease [Pseudomonadota bacterium]
MTETLSRYIFGRAARSLAIAFLVVTGIIMLVDFVEANRDLSSDANVSSLQLLGLTLLKTPSLIEQTIPFVVLFGMMGAINGMNRRSELIVMRASGRSAWGIVRPALVLAGAVGLIWAVAVNPLSTRMYDAFEDMSSRLTGGEPLAREGAVWLREGRGDQQIVIRAEEIDLASRTLADTTFLMLDVDMDGNTRFVRRFDAEYAILGDQGYWQLVDVTENAPGEKTQKLEGLSLPTTLDAESLTEQTTGERRAGFWSMPGEIRENELAGFSARDLRLRLNRLMALPIMLVAMTFIAAGVSMSLTREGGTLRLLITGAAVGFAVFFADSLVYAFGEVAILPVVVASWSVPVAVMLLGIAYLARIEDG